MMTLSPFTMEKLVEIEMQLVALEETQSLILVYIIG
jgi:hypothetical protein